MSAETAYKRQQRHKASGLCRNCSDLCFAGTLLCQRHLLAEREKARTRKGCGAYKGRGRRPAELSRISGSPGRA